MPVSSLTEPNDWGSYSQTELPSIGLVETNAWTAGMVACDAMDKAANIVVLQAEWNDMLGAVIKIAGSPSDVQSAVEAGARAAESMGQLRASHCIHRPDRDALRAIWSPEEYNVLIEQSVIKQPASESDNMSSSQSSGQALGFIETQGFTAVFEAIDTACKAASVEVVGKEKLGGGYVTVVIRGDVAAVTAAVEAAKPKIDGLGKLIACHVIARPSSAALGLLPK